MDLKHQLELAYLAANDPSEQNRATQRINVLEARIQKRRGERMKLSEKIQDIQKTVAEKEINLYPSGFDSDRGGGFEFWTISDVLMDLLRVFLEIEKSEATE